MSLKLFDEVKKEELYGLSIKNRVLIFFYEQTLYIGFISNFKGSTGTSSRVFLLLASFSQYSGRG